jgi:catechol 2,3-dioxygenase-like lactoylglutathione lyase family enzyme
MVQDGVKLTGIHHVELRVRDLSRSAAFYHDLFGLERRETIPPSDKVCVCTCVSDNGKNRFGIVLTEGLPTAVELAGLDHVSLSVPRDEEVLRLYNKACRLNVRATRPRIFDGHYQIFVFDPDGYKLEVMAEGQAYHRETSVR